VAVPGAGACRGGRGASFSPRRLWAVDEVGHGDLGRVVDVEVAVVGFAVELDELGLEVGADLAEDRLEVA